MTSENEFSGLLPLLPPEKLPPLPPETLSFLSGAILSVMYVNLHFRNNKDRAVAAAVALTPWILMVLVGDHFASPEIARMGYAGLAGAVANNPEIVRAGGTRRALFYPPSQSAMVFRP